MAGSSFNPRLDKSVKLVCVYSLLLRMVVMFDVLKLMKFCLDYCTLGSHMLCYFSDQCWRYFAVPVIDGVRGCLQLLVALQCLYVLDKGAAVGYVKLLIGKVLLLVGLRFTHSWYATGHVLRGSALDMVRWLRRCRLLLTSSTV
jgi:hypothetical protein